VFTLVTVSMSKYLAIHKIKFSHICITAILLLFCFSAFSPSNHSYSPKQTPVLTINFYMMGRDNLDLDVPLKIGENVEYLNQEFEGEIVFELNEIFMDSEGAYLPDLYANFRKGAHAQINRLVKPLEQKGGINVYLFDTYCEDNSAAALMGFTPRLKMREESYAKNSPRFDRIYIAYHGLEDKSTLVHEMGHFLGLKHPWELGPGDKYHMGLRNASAINMNHMAYGANVSSFTKQQLQKMKRHALKYRTYLMSKIISDYNRA